MIVEELMALLEEMDPEAEVRLASQPAWPFEWTISTVVEVEDSKIEGDQETGEEFWRETGAGRIVYIAEGQQLGYLPGYVSDQLGWRG